MDLDLKNNGHISFSEFCVACFDYKKIISNYWLEEIFNMIDISKTGYIDAIEIREFLNL